MPKKEAKKDSKMSKDLSEFRNSIFQFIEHQLLAILGNFRQFLATLDNFWQFLAPIVIAICLVFSLSFGNFSCTRHFHAIER